MYVAGRGPCEALVTCDGWSRTHLTPRLTVVLCLPIWGIRHPTPRDMRPQVWSTFVTPITYMSPPLVGVLYVRTCCYFEVALQKQRLGTETEARYNTHIHTGYGCNPMSYLPVPRKVFFPLCPEEHEM